MLTQRRSLLPTLVTLISVGVCSLTAQADPIQWRNNLDAAKVEASRTGKFVLLHFYTSTCGPCKKLERDVFSQPQIAAAMERDFVPVKLNADEWPAIANYYQISRVPSEVILNQHGNVIQKLSCPLEPNAYGSQLTQVAQHYRQRSGVQQASAQAPIHSAYAGLKIGGPTTNAKPTENTTQKPVAPALPAVTTNPYVNTAPPMPAASVPSRPPVQKQVAAPQLPANAMPNSYRDRYANAVPPLASKPQANLPTEQKIVAPAIVTNPMAQAPATPKPQPATAPPATPPVVAQEASPSVQAQPKPEIAKAPPAEAEVWPPKLPEGAPPLGFEGYCPVSLRQAKKWVRGDKSFGAIHRGQTYIFASAALRDEFLKSPDAYSPVFSGNDPVKLLDDDEKVAGVRKYGFEYRGAFYLFHSQQTMAKFASQPDRYSAGVRQAMTQMDGSDTIRR